MPRHHDVRVEDVDLKRLGSVPPVAYDRDLRGFADLPLVEKLGPRTLQTLAKVAGVIHFMERRSGSTIPPVFHSRSGAMPGIRFRRR